MLYRAIIENTPIGRLALIADDNYIIRIDFDKAENNEIDTYLTKHYGSISMTPGISNGLIKAMIQLTEYFEGKRKSFDLEVKLFGTPFQQKCWSELCKIPYGETISYKTLAIRVGNPKAYRAVGQANHNNPIPIVIPCHRVLASDNSLGGFGGGLEMKQKLLELERGN